MESPEVIAGNFEKYVQSSLCMFLTFLSLPVYIRCLSILISVQYDAPQAFLGE